MGTGRTGLSCAQGPRGPLQGEAREPGTNRNPIHTLTGFQGEGIASLQTLKLRLWGTAWKEFDYRLEPPLFDDNLLEAWKHVQPVSAASSGFRGQEIPFVRAVLCLFRHIHFWRNIWRRSVTPFCILQGLFGGGGGILFQNSVHCGVSGCLLPHPWLAPGVITEGFSHEIDVVKVQDECLLRVIPHHSPWKQTCGHTPMDPMDIRRCSASLDSTAAHGEEEDGGAGPRKGETLICPSRPRGLEPFCHNTHPSSHHGRS